MKTGKIIGITAAILGILAALIAIFEFLNKPEQEEPGGNNKTQLPKPEITIFQATPSVIKEGLSTQLTWSVQNASAVVIDQGIGQVSLKGSINVSPKITTSYTISVKNDGDIYEAKTLVTVTPLTWEDENSIGILPGDAINYFKVLDYSKDHFIAELSYQYNSNHGQVYIGAFLLDENDQNISRSFWPTAASSSGKTNVRVNVDQSLGPVTSEWVFFWIYESNKGDGFVSKRFPYRHHWN